ncbi:MAG: DUF4410 domain-containing protein [Candidatus Binatus sp.]|uniref:DUF4410 domain-containing protein n=1 Tax=Candidatus Binatus sp. TaxID=2811406 RepID=UPI0027292291|nr:DUF4410 domain-containing protein [Candidatus Binatus sp.]MDO8431635.1 DUF4410 domain-containing protein [Candidatus Binatus sp.]
MKSRLLNGMYVLIALAAAGCAGAQVTQETASTPMTASRPTAIYIYPFAVAPEDVKLNSGIVASTYRNWSGGDQNAEQLKIAKDTAHNVCVSVAATLSQKGFNAVCQERGIPVTASNVVIVDGEFTDISEGNRLRRMVIGLGVGASVLDTTVQLHQHNGGGTRQILEFTTHADSGKMPGAGITGPAGAAAGGATAVASIGLNVAAGGVKSVTSSTGYLADKTSTQIVDQIGKYYQNQGWGA